MFHASLRTTPLTPLTPFLYVCNVAYICLRCFKDISVVYLRYISDIPVRFGLIAGGPAGGLTIAFGTGN
jgi:hypothetical protein